MKLPPSFFSLAKKTMFRMAFHGKYGNVWNALMSVPEVSFAQIGFCLQVDLTIPLSFPNYRPAR